MIFKPNVLLIAPSAPPKNTAEAIQVRRILVELDKLTTGKLVTSMPDSSGWAQRDNTLAIALKHYETQVLGLPLHGFTSRIMMSHRMVPYFVPDSMVWITWMAGRVLRGLKIKPDIIYSRSSPMSAAMLAAKLQKKLNVPWIMHLSDPWAENPDKTLDEQDAKYEAECFHQADLITFTTIGQADHYKKRYPQLAHKITVSLNVMPDQYEMRTWLAHIPANPRDGRLHIVFAGNLYGHRSPEPLVQAIEILRTRHVNLKDKLHIDVYGYAPEAAITALKRAPDVIHFHGRVPFQEAYAMQNAADLVLTIEANSENPLVKGTLLSKVTDCLALGKAMLSITPEGSETARACNEGYGWAVSPANPGKLADTIDHLITQLPKLRNEKLKPAPECYTAKAVVAELVERMKQLIVANPR